MTTRRPRLNLSRQADLFSSTPGSRLDPSGQTLSHTTLARSLVSSLDEMEFVIIGCGGIGSNVANLLARLGAQHFTLFDPDDVAEPNIAPGWFHLGDHEIPKVYVVKERLMLELGVPEGNIDTSIARFKNQPTLAASPIVVIATDSMSSRRAAWHNRARLNEWRLWIDCRMGGDQCSIYTSLNPALEAARQNDDVQQICLGYLSCYEQSLQLPDTPLPCGMKSTAALTVGMIPAMVGLVLYRMVNLILPPKHLFYQMGSAWWTAVEP
jgi:hypothetical protein